MTISALIGKPYKHNGRGPNSFDCYGLVKYIYETMLGIYLPEYTDYTQDWYKERNVLTEQFNKFSDLWHPVDNLAQWDILTFSLGTDKKVTNHCGVYLNGEKMIHCYENRPVGIDRITKPYWENNLTGKMRYNTCQS